MLEYNERKKKERKKMHCPRCGEKEIVKNGSLTNGKPKYKCKVCGRQFVKDPRKGRISEETKELIDKLLLEKLPLSAIARVTGVSEQWLQSYVNKKYEEVKTEVEDSKKSKGRLTIECDELWSYVGNKENKQWIWLAMDKDTGRIVGVAIGDRSHKTAEQLWNSLPGVYRQCAVSYTDFWDAYSIVLPACRHRTVGKGKTNHIERFNCTLRQRVSRLVRKTLSFSKKLSNHIGAIWFFIHHYNATILT